MESNPGDISACLCQQPARSVPPIRICIFCGSSPGSRPEYRRVTDELATELVRRNLELIYGGGNVGLMGLLADAG